MPGIPEVTAGATDEQGRSLSGPRQSAAGIAPLPNIGSPLQLGDIASQSTARHLNPHQFGNQSGEEAEPEEGAAEGAEGAAEGAGELGELGDLAMVAAL